MYFAVKERAVTKSVRSAEVRSEVRSTQACSPNLEEGSFTVLLENCTEVTALGDCSSVPSEISSQTRDKLQTDVPSIKCRTFSKAMKQDTEIGGAAVNILFTASRDLTLSIKIFLTASQLPVRIRGVRFLIIDQAMNEDLLGRPLLKTLKFYLRHHMETVRE